MTSLSNKKILVTGASGFIGSFIVERALNLGAEVWALVRPSSSKRYLTDRRIHFITLDLLNPDKLKAQIKSHIEAEGRGWDHVIHAAGITKSIHGSDFVSVNADGTLNLALGLLREKAISGKFVFISSLSVMGAIKETPLPKGTGNDIYAPICETDTPKPNTLYGLSKDISEARLACLGSEQGLDYTILRPTGVYGPREHDYFLMAESICRHVDFAVGFKPQRITFVYVKDVADAALAACTRGKKGRAYFLTDGHAYNSRAFSDLLQEALQVKLVLHIKAPLWFLNMVCKLSEWISRITKKAATLNLDKYKILKQRNWLCDISAAREDLGYSPKYNLRQGVEETVEWYKQNKWL